MAQGLTQPVTKVSTKNISWGKDGRCVLMSNLPISCADCEELWEPHPPGSSTVQRGLFYFYPLESLAKPTEPFS
jgi:hypothetical protein